MPQVIEANGLRFGYHSMGEGPLVLFLHGFPDTAKAWDEIATPIAVAGYRSCAVYLRGYSPTEIPPHDTTIDDLAADTVGLIRAFTAEPAVIVGHDWGGIAGYGAAALEPGLVKQLVTVAIPHPAGLDPGLKDLWSARHFLSFRMKKAPERFVANDFAGLRKIYERWSPEWDFTESDLADIKRCLANPESRDAIFGYYRALDRKPNELMRRRIEVPTVAFAGRTDGAVRLSAFDDAATRFESDYRVIETPGGHFLHREDPELFTNELLSVLQSG